MTAAKRMRGFAELMEDPESKALLERAKTRRTESTEVILPWRVTQHEVWLDSRVALVGKDHEEVTDDPISDEPGSDAEDKDPRVVLDSFRHDHPRITADMDDITKTITVYRHIFLRFIYNAN